MSNKEFISVLQEFILLSLSRKITEMAITLSAYRYDIKFSVLIKKKRMLSGLDHFCQIQTQMEHLMIFVSKHHENPLRNT